MLDLLRFVVDDALYFRLVQTIRDGVIALRDIDYTAYGMRGPFRSQNGEKRYAPCVT